MMNFLSSISNRSRQASIKGWALVIVLFVILPISSGCSSPQNPSSLWDGAFPAGEFHIKIQKHQGDPVQGAVMKVFEGGTKDIALGYPIDNFLSNKDLISNELGVIIALHEPQGIEFGGVCWKYLLFFERCSDAPKYDAQVSADGYKTLDFSINEMLFNSGNEKSKIGTTSFTFESGEVTEIPKYEIVFTLEQP